MLDGNTRADRVERRFTAEQPASSWDAQVNRILSTAPLRCPSCGHAGEWICCDPSEVDQPLIPGETWYEYLSRPKPATGTGWVCSECGRISIDPKEGIGLPARHGYAPCPNCGKISDEPWCQRCGTRLEEYLDVRARPQWQDGNGETTACVQYITDGIALERANGKAREDDKRAKSRNRVRGHLQTV